jgi:hypothetical protein
MAFEQGGGQPSPEDFGTPNEIEEFLRMAEQQTGLSSSRATGNRASTTKPSGQPETPRVRERLPAGERFNASWLGAESSFPA